MIVELTQENFTKETNVNGLILLDFYMKSCVPCKMMMPLIEELSNKYEDKLLIGKIQADIEHELVEDYDILSVPTFIFLKGSKVIGQFKGIVSKSVIEDFIVDNS